MYLWGESEEGGESEQYLLYKINIIKQKGHQNSISLSPRPAKDGLPFS